MESRTDPGTGQIAEPPFPAERLRGVRTEGCAGNGLENLEPREWWGELMEAEAFQGATREKHTRDRYVRKAWKLGNPLPRLSSRTACPEKSNSGRFCKEETWGPAPRRGVESTDNINRRGKKETG